MKLVYVIRGFAVFSPLEVAEMLVTLKAGVTNVLSWVFIGFSSGMIFLSHFSKPQRIL